MAIVEHEVVPEIEYTKRPQHVPRKERESNQEGRSPSRKKPDEKQGVGKHNLWGL